jgi:hypothetical protein
VGRRRTRVPRPCADDGGIITGWLLQLVTILAVVALLAHEVIAVGVAAVDLDDTGREVGTIARDVYRSERSLPRAQAAVEAELVDRTAELVSMEVVGEELVLTLGMRARTLVAHRVAPLEDLATASTTRRVRWQP